MPYSAREPRKLGIACKAIIWVLKLFSFGIQIEVAWVNMAQRMCKHEVLINFYSRFYIEIEWLKHYNSGSLQTGLTILAYGSQMGNKQLGKCSKIGRTFKSQRWKNANSTDHFKIRPHLVFFLSQSFYKDVIWQLIKPDLYKYEKENPLTY